MHNCLSQGIFCLRSMLSSLNLPQVIFFFKILNGVENGMKYISNHFLIFFHAELYLS